MVDEVAVVVDVVDVAPEVDVDEVDAALEVDPVVAVDAVDTELVDAAVVVMGVFERGSPVYKNKTYAPFGSISALLIL